MVSVPIIAISRSFIVAIIDIITEHNRKKELIEKVNEISDTEKLKILSDTYPSIHDDSALKYGAILVGIGVGLLVGGFIHHRLGWVTDKWSAYLVGASIIGGFALILVYFYSIRNRQIK